MEKLLLQLTFLTFIFILYRKGLNNFIFIPLLYYIISSIPLFYYTFGDSSWNFYTNHLLINNTIILLSFITANFLPKFFGTLLILPSLISISKRTISLKFTYTLVIIFFIFEILQVIFYDKAFFISSLINLSLKLDRVIFVDEFFYLIQIWNNNYYGFLLTFIIFIFGLILTKNKKSLIDFVILFIVIIMYMGMLKKSAIIMIGLAYIMIRFNINKKIFSFNLREIFLIIIFGLIFNFVLISYYGHEDHIYSEIVKRIFLEPIIHTKNFYEIFSYIDPSLKYLPSEGGLLFGIENIRLEKSLFYEVYQNRAQRYGNTPVLSLTYGLVSIGNLVFLYLFVLYTLFFASGKYLDNYLKSNMLSKRTFAISLSLFFMPIFLSGAFKVFSIFIIYPISLLLIFVAYKLLPKT
jgi:hypothetical protein